MKVYFHEKRPDGGFPIIEILLKNQKKNAAFNEKIYLKNNIIFSDSKTPFWIVFYKKNKKITAEVCIIYENEKIKNTYDVILEENITNTDSLTLQNAKWLGNDLFLKMYSNKDIYIFGFYEKGIEEILSFSKEDILVFDKGNWRVKKDKENTQNYSIAKILSCDVNKLILQFWSKDKKENKIILNKNLMNQRFFVVNNYITDLFLRSNNKISLFIEKKRVLLGEKDLLYKERGRWRKEKLQRFQEKKIFPDIFFVFDSLTKEKDNVIFKGYFFNKKRNQIQLIEKKIFQNRNLKNKRRR